MVRSVVIGPEGRPNLPMCFFTDPFMATDDDSEMDGYDNLSSRPRMSWTRYVPMAATAVIFSIRVWVVRGFAQIRPG